MSASEPDLKVRTKGFALRILKLVDALPKTTGGRALASQMVRSGTFCGGELSSCLSGQIHAGFYFENGRRGGGGRRDIVLAGATEESSLIAATRLAEIQKEAHALVAITEASIKIARKNHPR